MTDFTLRVKKMPNESVYYPGKIEKGGKVDKNLRDESLRALLYNHYS